MMRACNLSSSRDSVEILTTGTPRRTNMDWLDSVNAHKRLGASLSPRNPKQLLPRHSNGQLISSTDTHNQYNTSQCSSTSVHVGTETPYTTRTRSFVATEGATSDECGQSNVLSSQHASYSYRHETSVASNCIISPQSPPLPYDMNATSEVHPSSAASLLCTSSQQQRSTLYSSALLQTMSLSEGAAAGQDASLHLLTAAQKAANEAHDQPRTVNLYEEAIRSKLAKQRWRALEKARQELLETARIAHDCTFKPSVSPYAARIQRPTALSPEHRVEAEVLRRKQWMAMKQQQAIERELQDCTFRPLTLRTIRMESPPGEVNPQVFDELYQQAQEQHYFETVTRPKVVEQIDRRLTYGGSPDVPLTSRTIQEVVDRLFSKAAVVSSDTPAEASEETHKPALSPQTNHIIQEKIRTGERGRNIVTHLHHGRRDPSLETVLKTKIRSDQEDHARLQYRQALEEDRQRLQWERVKAVVASKFHHLAQYAAQRRHEYYRKFESHPVADLAMAALDRLSSTEVMELLEALERSCQTHMRENDFVMCVIHNALDRGMEATSPLLHAAPPLSYDPPYKRASSMGGEGERALSDTPTAPPQPKREKISPATKKRLAEKRETQRAQWVEEARQRQAERDGTWIDPAWTFRPAPRRLIPHDCRPDVHVTVKTTRTARLRRAHTIARAVVTPSNVVRQAPPVCYAGSLIKALVPDAVSEGDQQPPKGDGHGKHSHRTAPRDSPTRFSLVNRGIANPSNLSNNWMTKDVRSATRGSSPPNVTSVCGRPPSVKKARQPTSRTYAENVSESARGTSARPAAEKTSDGVAPRGRGEPNPQFCTEQALRSAAHLSSSLALAAAQQERPPRLDHQEATQTVTQRRQERLYRGIISEHAAFGGKAALEELGRELLLKQLLEHHKRRR